MNGVWTLLAVAIGGSIGALLRGGAESLSPATGLEAWVIILLINLVGCLLIGYLLVWLECRLNRNGQSRLHFHPRAYRLGGIAGLLASDPTLPPTVIAASARRLRIESGLLMTGLLGGLTTFSSFALDVVLLIEDGRWGIAGLDAGASIVGGTLAALLGLELGLLQFGKNTEPIRE
jgi:fluoride ion exporter CrcB/FEX